MKPMLSGQSIMHINCGKWQGSTTCTQETCSEQVSIFIQINKRDVGLSNAGGGCINRDKQWMEDGDSVCKLA